MKGNNPIKSHTAFTEISRFINDNLKYNTFYTQ